DAQEEEQYRIAEATIKTDGNRKLSETRVNIRYQRDFSSELVDKVDYVDANPSEMVSISAALIPFISSDVGKFPLMGSNMENQAVPLINPAAPWVGTGMERPVVVDSGRTIVAAEDGQVTYVDGRKVEVAYQSGKTATYYLEKFKRTNNDTCYNQQASVVVGQQVKAGDVLIDG